MVTFNPDFLRELKAGLLQESLPDLAAQVDALNVCEYSQNRHPLSQWIYVVPKASLPRGTLDEIVLGEVKGLFCLFVHEGRIAIVETMSRDVLIHSGRELPC